jgi:hypothetical protein
VIKPLCNIPTSERPHSQLIELSRSVVDRSGNNNDIYGVGAQWGSGIIILGYPLARKRKDALWIPLDPAPHAGKVCERIRIDA